MIARMTQPPSSSTFPDSGRRFPAFAMRLVRVLAALTLLAFAGLALLFALLWREHKTEITLPTLTGHFAVGRATDTWVNNAQRDELAPSPGAKREVIAWMWYPSETATTAAPAEYLPAAWRSALAKDLGVLMSRFLTRDLSLVRTHSTRDPDISPEQRSYPVVILRAGGGALTTDFTTLAEDLASHGYFVVGFDAPYRTFVVVLPDGRVVGRSPAYHVENANGNLADPVIGKLLQMWTAD